MRKILSLIIIPILNTIRFFLKIIIDFLIYALNIIKIHAITKYEFPKPKIKKTINIFNDSQNIRKVHDLFLEDEYKDCYNHFKKHFYTSILVPERKNVWDYAIKKSLSNYENENLYLEFGVFKGKSINYAAKKLVDIKIYGFDSFEGLKEDWVGASSFAGRFSLNGKIPKLEPNVSVIKGWVQDTISKFLDENKSKKINYVHFDLDTYNSTKFVLEKIKPHLKNKCIIVFDELYNYPAWRYGEYKALTEVLDEKEYKYICFHTEPYGSVAIEYNKVN